MDSKNIHISFQHYLNDIEWERHGESEWIFVGAEEEFNETKTAELLDSFIKENELYLITDRHKSLEIQKDMAIPKVMEFIKEYNPALANLDFSKIMEFNKIGIVRRGIRKSNNKNGNKETTAGNNT